MKLVIYFRTSDPETISRIRQKFGITAGMNINYEVEADILAEDMELLRETAKRGFIEIRIKKTITNNHEQTRI